MTRNDRVLISKNMHSLAAKINRLRKAREEACPVCRAERLLVRNNYTIDPYVPAEEFRLQPSAAEHRARVKYGRLMASLGPIAI